MKQKRSINGKKNEKLVIILGDSILKHINIWEILKRLQHCKVYVKHFSGAKTQCMKYYLKPSQRQNPSHFILHLATNDVT